MPISYIFTEPILFVAWAAALVIAITVHEFAHAYAAYLQGDNTAKDEGRLNLNPLSHLSLLGTIFLFIAGFGWGKPVPFNPYNLKNQRWGPVWVALAGPFSNLLLVLGFGLMLRFGAPALGLSPDNGLYIFLYLNILLNLILMAFNLLPIPPLDGSKLLFALLPDSLANVKAFLQQYGFYILIAFVILGSPILGAIFSGLQLLTEIVFVP